MQFLKIFFPSSSRHILLGPLVSCCLVIAGAAYAQEANVLGLPAIPQPKPGMPANPAVAASGAKPAPSAYPMRDMLAGEMGLQHSALNGIGRMIVTTKAVFSKPEERTSALDAARSVQRELSSSCLKQCQPQKMTAPKILASGQMEFELVFRPLYQHLNQVQFVAALQSKPLNLTAAQLNAPPPVPQLPPGVSVKVTTQSSAP